LRDEETGEHAHAGMAIVTIEGKESPRAVAILLRMITDATLPQGWRQNALDTVREVKPAALAKATPDLIRQLGDASVDVRRTALELLSMIIHDTRAVLPDLPEGK
jgi:HEAT repeat protein